MGRTSSAGTEPEQTSTVVEEEAGGDGLPAKLAELSVSAPKVEETASVPQLNALGIARIDSIDAAGRVTLLVGSRPVAAKVDAAVHGAVLQTAHEKGEAVLVEQRGAELWVVGALRTQPTPGVDKMDTVTIDANRIEMRAKEEIAMSSGVAAIAVRAVGEVETYAERILSRAESVHKIIGRMLRLN